MANKELKLAALRNEFSNKTQRLHSQDVSAEEKWALLLARVQIAAEMRRVLLEVPHHQPQLSVAGSKNKAFVDTMRQKGLIFRYVEDKPNS